MTSRTRPDYVLGVSPASTSLAQMTMRTPVDSALDLGTGCGVQSLHLARHARRVVATDVNPRALQLSRLTAALNQVEVDIRDGSLYEPVAGERFDLVVTNPPYVMSPPTTQARVVQSMFPSPITSAQSIIGAMKPGPRATHTKSPSPSQAATSPTTTASTAPNVPRRHWSTSRPATRAGTSVARK